MRLIILFSLLLVSCANVMAQQRLGLNFKSYTPQGDFNQNIDHAPAGLSLIYTRNIADTRFFWGGELGVAMYASDEYLYELDSEGYPGEFVDVYEEDCFWSVHAIGQYEYLSTVGLKAYVELRLGMTTFFSERSAGEDPRFEASFAVHGTAFNTGLGTGILVNPRATFSSKEPGNLWINLGVTAHSGSNTQYRHVESGGGVYSLGDGIYRSLTHYTDYRLGIVYAFGE